MFASIGRFKRGPTAAALVAGLLLLAGCGGGQVGSGTPVVVVTRTVTASAEPTMAPGTTATATAHPAPGTGAWAAVAAGSYTTLALRRDGTLWSWGLNDYGQLGRGFAGVSAGPIPRQVGRRHDWSAVSAGYGDSFALRSDGSLWAWGNNSDFGGNLGLGDAGKVTVHGITIPRDRWSPARVGRAEDWAALSGGFQHSVAVKMDGTLWGWGANFYGALGPQGSTSLVLVPTEIALGADWASAAAGGDFSLAVNDDGSLWATGSNMYGNLGLGDSADRHRLTRVGRDRDWAAASAGLGYSLAVKQDGSLWAWGGNDFGQLGLGDTTAQDSPTQVGTATDWVQAVCLGHHSLALRRDGSLWAWGENGFGQLGVGDRVDRHSPAQVGVSRDWAALAPGSAASYHSAALRRDGSLWTWGLNRYGQLGLGDTNDRLSPAKVVAR
jgi:alpha-tubulin suppressor-like RCC1 family protein